jgi:hypothetical protein
MPRRARIWDSGSQSRALEYFIGAPEPGSVKLSNSFPLVGIHTTSPTLEA